MKYHDGSTILPRLKCPSCGYQFDAATALGETATPKGGDVSLCLSCGEPSLFTGSETLGYGLRVPTPEDREQIIMQPDIAKARLGISVLRHNDPNWPKAKRP